MSKNPQDWIREAREKIHELDSACKCEVCSRLPKALDALSIAIGALHSTVGYEPFNSLEPRRCSEDLDRISAILSPEGKGEGVSDTRFLPKTFNKRLAHLVEECGEALAAAGKTQRFGRDAVNPLLPTEKQETNIDWLLRELADLKSAIARFEESL